jgi:hypothetical protein
MSDNKNTELIKALEGIMSPEEIETLLKAKEAPDEAEEDKKPEKKEGEDDEDEEYSEEKAGEIKKALDLMKEKHDKYMAKKKEPAIEKSVDVEELTKSFEDKISSMKSEFEKSTQEMIEKSLEEMSETLTSIKEENQLLKSELGKIGKETPSFKSIDRMAFIEKANDGIKQGDKIFYSTGLPAHKEKIGEILSQALEKAPKDSDLQKSLDVDLSNFVSGYGHISKSTVDYLDREMNIVLK